MTFAAGPYNMAYRLPPLNAMRVFEAAARHKSFKSAAEELNITASAVSHAVQNLEDWLGIQLFLRGKRGLELTEVGASYYPHVGKALKAMAEATARIPSRRARGRLSVSSAPSFASCWLLRRLPEFLEKNPDVSVNLQTTRHYVDLPLEGVDIAIRMAPASKAADNWTHLVAEVIVPVCSPLLRLKYKDMSDAEFLSSVPLIHMTAVSVDWAEWFRLTDGKAPRGLEAGLRVDTVQMALEAAAGGLGVALGRTPLVEEEIASKRLTRAVDNAVPSGLSYWLVAVDEEFQSPELRSFRDWLQQEFQNRRPSSVSPPRRRT